MPDATFACPDLTTFCRLDELGLEVTGQRLEPDRAVLACRVVEPDQWCRRCGCEGAPRDSVVRRAGARAVRVATDDAAGDGPPVPVHRLRARVAPGHQQGGGAAGEAVPSGAAVGAGGDRVPAPDRRPGRRGPRGRLEHRQRRGPRRGPARPDRRTRPGSTASPWSGWMSTCGGTRGAGTSTSPSSSTSPRSVTAPDRPGCWTWSRAAPRRRSRRGSHDRPQAWRDGVEVVAMDGFTGFKTATTEELPDAVAVMDPFHVVRLAGDALDRCRRRVQQDLHGHRGRSGDPLYAARRTLHTGDGLLTDKQNDRLQALFAVEEHVEVEATWGIYQRMIGAYREPDRTRGRELMTRGHRVGQHRCPRRADRAHHPRPHPEASAPPTCWPTSTGPAPATARPRRSTDASSTSAAPPSASATSPTTSPDHSWRQADSDHDYTLLS